MNSVKHTKCMNTVLQENCAVVLLYVLMDDTHTIDVKWIFLCGFFIYVYFLCTKMQVCRRNFYCAVNHCPHI